MEHITINSDRSVTVPVELRKIGVQYDHNVNTIEFVGPRYSSNVDLSTMTIYINYILSDKTPGKYKAENVIIDDQDDSLIRFNWTITRNVTKVSGILSCLVCAKKTDEEGNEINHWNTDIFRLLSVSEGMENDLVIQEQYPDIITSLIQNVNEHDAKLLEFSGLDTRVTDIENNVDGLKGDIVKYNIANIMPDFANKSPLETNNVKFGTDDGRTYTVEGLADGSGFPRYNFYNNTEALPEQLVAGNTYPVKVTSTNPASVYVEFYFYLADGTFKTIVFHEDGDLVVPNDTVGLIFRISTNSKTATYSDAITIEVLNRKVEYTINNTYTTEYTNEYTTNHYTNNYTLTATPSITTDTNSYLAPTGDLTDRYTEIQTMLEATGVCRLGAGNYYVSRPLNVRDNQMLIGAGKGTIIYKRSNFVGEYIVKMGSYSTVKDLQIRGVATVTVQETIGDVHAILIEGNADGDANDIPVRMTVENVEIARFNGGAITFRNTGLSTACCAMVSNMTIYDCDAGINVAYFSEFNHFNNIRANNCYYGCVNNGGNNVFTNCDFSGNKVGMLMDNSMNQSPNNTHGSAAACVFDHSDGNKGFGLKVLNCKNGYTFVGCQFFYSKILFDNSEGLVVADSIFGSANTDIIVNGGGAVLFNGNMHGSQPTSIAITDNDKVHFVNCFVKNTGAAVGS